MATAEATTTSMAQPALPLGLLALPIYDNNEVTSVCAHNGRFVVFLSDGTALELADGSWSEDYEVAVAGGCGHDDIVESVILG